MRKIVPIVLVVCFILAGCSTTQPTPEPVSTPTATPTSVLGETISEEVVITHPQAQAAVSSPVIIAGRAPGTWFFEGSIPVEIQDEKGVVLGQAALSAQGEWMTEQQVAFTGQVPFTKSAIKKGFIVIKKDNPSGLPENSDEIQFPITFLE